MQLYITHVWLMIKI